MTDAKLAVISQIVITEYKLDPLKGKPFPMLHRIRRAISKKYAKFTALRAILGVNDGEVRQLAAELTSYYVEVSINKMRYTDRLVNIHMRMLKDDPILKLVLELHGRHGTTVSIQPQGMEFTKKHFLDPHHIAPLEKFVKSTDQGHYFIYDHYRKPLVENKFNMLIKAAEKLLV